MQVIGHARFLLKSNGMPNARHPHICKGHQPPVNLNLHLGGPLESLGVGQDLWKVLTQDRPEVRCLRTVWFASPRIPMTLFGRPVYEFEGGGQPGPQPKTVVPPTSESRVGREMNLFLLHIQQNVDVLLR